LGKGKLSIGKGYVSSQEGTIFGDNSMFALNCDYARKGIGIATSLE